MVQERSCYGFGDPKKACGCASNAFCWLHTSSREREEFQEAPGNRSRHRLLQVGEMAVKAAHAAMQAKNMYALLGSHFNSMIDIKP